MKHRDEPFRAWRLWRLSLLEEEPTLYSVTQLVPWEGPFIVAHKKPTKEDYRRGIYGLRKKPNINDVDHILNIKHDRSAVLGLIDLFGRVVECEFGYRSEKALINLIDLSFNLCEHKGFLNLGKWCEEKALCWYHKKSNLGTSLGFATPRCPKHSPRKTEKAITVPELAKIFVRKYGCEVII
jgi:hypothetical protein